jgi:predicted MFS family arabinose efflux permease
VAGLCGSLAAFGFGRFAYTALLPPMRTDLALSYSAAGWLASANLIAYLIGAVAAGTLTGKAGPQRLLQTAITAVCLPLIGLSVSRAYALLVVFMALLGFISALLWIAVVALLTGPSVPAGQRGALLGLTALGSGWGIPVVAVLVIVLRVNQDPSRWQAAWLVMGLATAGLAAGTWWAIRPAGGSRSHPQERPASPRRSMLNDLRERPARRICLIYGMYGFGYSVFVTFAVAFLRLHVSAGASLGIWAFLGLSAGVGGLLIGQGSDRWSKGLILSLSLVATGIAAGLPIWTSSLAAVIISVIGFGFPMIGIGTVVAAYLGDLFSDAARSGSLFATATVLFGLGQGAGPGVAGLLIDSTGSFTLPFILSSGTLLVAAAVASRLPPARPRSEGPLASAN